MGAVPVAGAPCPFVWSVRVCLGWGRLVAFPRMCVAGRCHGEERATGRAAERPTRSSLERQRESVETARSRDRTCRSHGGGVSGSVSDRRAAGAGVTLLITRHPRSLPDTRRRADKICPGARAAAAPRSASSARHSARTDRILQHKHGQKLAQLLGLVVGLPARDHLRMV